MSLLHLDIAERFSPHLGGRFRADGDWSGQEFREEILEPAFREYDKIVVHLDSIEGYTSSFFEEAFGGLVREHGYTYVAGRIRFVAAQRDYLVPQIVQWMKKADGSRK